MVSEIKHWSQQVPAETAHQLYPIYLIHVLILVIEIIYQDFSWRNLTPLSKIKDFIQRIQVIIIFCQIGSSRLT